jgi:DNA repair ATPase RecN
MDEQRLKDLLECGEGASCGNLDAVRRLHEALSSQEEELRKLRDEVAAEAAAAEAYRQSVESLEEELRSLREERDELSEGQQAFKSSWEREVRKRTEAEAELLRLREGMLAILEEAWFKGATWEARRQSGVGSVNRPIQEVRGVDLAKILASLSNLNGGDADESGTLRVRHLSRDGMSEARRDSAGGVTHPPSNTSDSKAS